MGRTEDALIGTKPGAPKGFVGPHVPALSKALRDDTFDAIGRAYSGGLLDAFRAEPGDIRDAARAFAVLYWRKLPAPNPVSGLYRNMVPGLVEELPAGVDRERAILDADERDEAQERRLNQILFAFQRRGGGARAAFDQLVIDCFADDGPPWLDRLLQGRGSLTDRDMLNRAVGAIVEFLL